MRIVFFCQSLVSDWNHGHAHFLRGVAAELLGRGHEVRVFEPAVVFERHVSWNAGKRSAQSGRSAVTAFHRADPTIVCRPPDRRTMQLDEALDGADVVIVHEWNPHALVTEIGRHHARGGRYVLLFHDTHHRSVTEPAEMARYDLHHYDGVLAFGEAIRQRYLALGWARQAWTWHEAADTRTFWPREAGTETADLVWIGNWGEGERARDLRAYLIEPARDLGLRTTVYGAGYTGAATMELEAARIRYAGWLPNAGAPQVYANHRMTVHLPRLPYLGSLPGIPTIRVFEALASGVPLVSVAWRDVERLFCPGEDFLVASTPAQMRVHLAALRDDPDLRRSLVRHGLATIRRRHTCAHRVDELFDVVRQARGGLSAEVLSA
jgi:spore maturation protein CgeB